DELTRLRRAWATLEEGHDTAPTPDSLAVEADLAPTRVAALLPYLSELASLDAPVDDAGETELVDLVADAGAEQPEAAALDGALAPAVARILALLDVRLAVRSDAAASPAAPEEHRQDHTEDPDGEQNDTNGIDVETVARDVHCEREHGSHRNQEQADTDTHVVLLLQPLGACTTSQ